MSDYMYVVVDAMDPRGLSKEAVERDVKQLMPKDVAHSTRDKLRIEVSAREGSTYFEPFLGVAGCGALLGMKKRAPTVMKIVETLVSAVRTRGARVSLLMYRDTGRKPPTIEEVGPVSLEEVLAKGKKLALNTRYVLAP